VLRPSRGGRQLFGAAKLIASTFGIRWHRQIERCTELFSSHEDGEDKNVPRFGEVVTGVQQPINLHAVLGPLLDLVEAALIGTERIVGFFVGPIIVAHRRPICDPL
jgi:hypothetical protein